MNVDSGMTVEDSNEIDRCENNHDGNGNDNDKGNSNINQDDDFVGVKYDRRSVSR